MTHSSYISKIKDPKFILAILLILVAFSAIYNDIIFSYINKKTTSGIKSQVLDVQVAEDYSNDNSKAVVLENSYEDDERSENSDVEQDASQEKEISLKGQASEQSYYVINTLITVHNMISKFFQNIEYSAELNKIRKIVLPKNVTLVLDDMQNYNDKYLSSNTSFEDVIMIFPAEGITDKIIGKFIKVRKNTSDSLEKAKTHEIIVKNIHILEEYFYSTKFLDRFN